VSNPKIVCTMAVHKRKEVTIATVRQLQKQTIPVEVILIGGCDKEKEIAEAVNVRYFEYRDKPLGAKLQFGVDIIKKMKPDYMLRCGSDDWLSSNWCEFMLSKFRPNVGLVGALTYYIAEYIPNKPVQISWREAYKGTGRFGEPIGPGRIFDCKFLEMLGWKLFQTNRYCGMDSVSFKRIKSLGTKHYGYKGDEIACLAVKGNWPRITSINKCERVHIENNDVFMDKFFPGCDTVLENLRGITE